MKTGWWRGSEGRRGEGASWESGSEDVDSEVSLELDAEVGRAEKGLRGCHLLFFSQGAYDETRRPRWSHSAQYFLALSSYVLGIYHVTTFPNAVSKYGGWAFVVAYLGVGLVLGFPFLSLELLLGQFTSLNTAHIYRRLCPVTVGLGWASLFIGLVRLIFSIPTLGLYANSLVFFLLRAPRPCSDPSILLFPDASACFDYRASTACATHNASEGVYLKGRCFPRPQLPREFLDLVQDCVEDPDHSYGHNSGQVKLLTQDLIQWNAACGVAFHFERHVLEKTRWLRRYLDSPYHFLLTQPRCGYRTLSYWSTMETSSDRHSPLIRIQLYPDPIVSRYHSPHDSAVRLRNFLRHTGYSLFHLVREYCLFARLGPLSACLPRILTSRETFPTTYIYAHLTSAPQQSIEILGPIVGFAAAIWVIVLVPSIKGPQWIGPLVTFTSTMPLVFFIALLSYGAQLEGFWYGVRELGRPDWCALLDPNTWIMACWENLLSLPISSGVLPVIASYGSFHQDTFVHALGVCVWSMGFAVLAAVTQFGLVGVIATRLGRQIQDFYDYSDTSFFILINFELERLEPSGRLLPIMFSLAMILIGLGSAWGIFEAVICHVTEHVRPFLKRRILSRVFVSFVTALLAFILGLPCMSAQSSAWTDKVMAMQILLLLVNSCLTAVTIVVIYGLADWSLDLDLMFGVGREAESDPPISRAIWSSRARHCFHAAWSGFPFLTIVLLIWELVVVTENQAEMGLGKLDEQEEHKHNGTDTPSHSFLFFQKGYLPLLLVLYLVALVVPTGVVAVKVRRRGGDLGALVTPARRWGPALLDQREQDSTLSHGHHPHPPSPSSKGNHSNNCSLTS